MVCFFRREKERGGRGGTLEKRLENWSELIFIPFALQLLSINRSFK